MNGLAIAAAKPATKSMVLKVNHYGDALKYIVMTLPTEECHMWWTRTAA